MLLTGMLPEWTKPKPEIIQIGIVGNPPGRTVGSHFVLSTDSARPGSFAAEVRARPYVEGSTDPTRRPPTCAGARSTDCLTR